MSAPVFGITVLRYADGRTEVRRGIAENMGDCAEDPDLVVPMPESWEHRHQMLTDAQAEVKRMAGVEHGEVR